MIARTPSRRTAIGAGCASGAEVVIVDAVDGRMLGTIDSVRARSQVHPGALYLHQGESFVVDELDLAGLEDFITVLSATTDNVTRGPREPTRRPGRAAAWGAAAAWAAGWPAA